MALADRARAMIAQPAQEWPIIAGEPSSRQEILRGYVVPLAIIGPIFTLAGALIFGHRNLIYACSAAVLEFILEIIGVFVIAFLADALVTSFGGTNDPLAAFKWVAYSSTPRWVAGIFTIVPFFGSLIVLVASLYSLYLLYIGAAPVMRVAPDKTVGYTLVVVVAYIVVAFAITFLLSLLLGLFFAAGAIATGASIR